MNSSTFPRLLAATLMIVLCHNATAQIPQIINCQGKISVGATPFTGTGQFKFALVNGGGTTSYWSHDGTMMRAREALEAAGFVHRRIESLGEAAAMDVFLDGPDAKVRDAVHVLWAGEKAMPDALEATPQLGVTEKAEGFELIPLADLVRMKLISFRDKDRMHLRDLIGVGLVDQTWPVKFPAGLAARLQMILDDPEGLNQNDAYAVEIART